jgi:hypothetical protein
LTISFSDDGSKVSASLTKGTAGCVSSESVLSVGIFSGSGELRSSSLSAGGFVSFLFDIEDASELELVDSFSEATPRESIIHQFVENIKPDIPLISTYRNKFQPQLTWAETAKISVRSDQIPCHKRKDPKEAGRNFGR